MIYLEIPDTSGITHSLGDASNSENSGDDAETNANVTKKNYTLTGNPQIDYVHDPNLPRELNGYNLSAYPFFSRVPTNINFSCDGLKDGFYASIEHKCQVWNFGDFRFFNEERLGKHN